ncbi:MAG TPA: PIN domain-containing protein [Stellaceae bacterium]|jgi:predicted nucleic acid-binding protein|nr:PIN domain-containing protein [Stellaceae bacterium]
MRVAVDTNILAYVEGVNGKDRQQLAGDLVSRLPEDTRVLPAQVLGELYNVLVKKLRWSGDQARAAVAAWRNAFILAPTTLAAMNAAIDLAADHRLSIWDSVMLSVAAESGCRLLLSEDLQDGFVWRGVTVANPFARVRHRLLDALLSPE